MIPRIYRPLIFYIKIHTFKATRWIRLHQSPNKSRIPPRLGTWNFRESNGEMCLKRDTVDGRNPEPPGMYETLWIMVDSPHQLVQDFFHQQYAATTWRLFPGQKKGAISLDQDRTCHICLDSQGLVRLLLEYTCLEECFNWCLASRDGSKYQDFLGKKILGASFEHSGIPNHKVEGLG